MKINYYHKLDLTKSTEITIIRPKKRRRRTQADTYDFNDKLIENMENDDELVFLETEINNFFVYQGELEESARKTLKKYTQKTNKAQENGGKETKPDGFSEFFSAKSMALYKEKKEELNQKLQKFNFKEKNSENDKIPPELDSILFEFIILDSLYTLKSFDEIINEIVSLNGPTLKKEFLDKISLNLNTDIEVLSGNLNSKLNDLIQKNERDEQNNLKFDKNLIFSVCDLIDKKIKNYYIGHLQTPGIRKTTRKLRKEFIQNILQNFEEKDVEYFKKILTKYDFLKEKKKLTQNNP